MNILVYNCGSSSLKFRLYAMPEERELAGGEFQRIGSRTSESPVVVYRVAGEARRETGAWKTHAEAAESVYRIVALAGASRIDAVGHRIVHGGERFHASTRIDIQSQVELEALNPLAPIHNPPATALLRTCLSGSEPQVAVFDTSFHQGMPDAAYVYPLPRREREEYGLRKYGFHGTSHRFVCEEAARILGIELTNLDAVSCHLGSGGASLCSVRSGRSFDNTMGYSPLQGLIMSTRCGDLPGAAVMRLLDECDDRAEEVEKILNRESGVLGMSGSSGDIRDVISMNERGGDPRSAQTIAAYTWRLRKYLGAYLALTGSARAVIFTDTIGERVPLVRQAISAGLSPFGLVVDEDLNAHCIDRVADIATAGSSCRALVIPTNEELAIARETAAVLMEISQP